MRQLVLEQLPTVNEPCSAETICPVSHRSDGGDSLANRLSNRIGSGDVFCSFELTPPKCGEDLLQLIHRFDLLQAACSPVFQAVTSHAIFPDHPGLQLARSLGGTTLLHLVAGQLTRAQVRHVLDAARMQGVASVFALRGDVTHSKADFPHAVNLVAFIRENYGSYFTVCVAGYPCTHPQAVSYKQDLSYLKQKVFAGADFIITQVVLDSHSFIQFVRDCRTQGIAVPIIPGILAVQSYQSLIQMSRLCQFAVPKQILDVLEHVRYNNEAVVNYAVFHTVQMIKQLFTLRITQGIHIFTLNRVIVPLELCHQLGLCLSQPVRPLKTHTNCEPYKLQAWEEKVDNMTRLDV